MPHTDSGCLSSSGRSPQQCRSLSSAIRYPSWPIFRLSLPLGPAAQFFLTEYPTWKPADKDLRTNAFRAKLSDFLLDPRMKAIFGASSPGIDWGEVLRKRQIVLLDFRHETDDAARRLKMLW